MLDPDANSPSPAHTAGFFSSLAAPEPLTLPYGVEGARPLWVQSIMLPSGFLSIYDNFRCVIESRDCLAEPEILKSRYRMKISHVSSISTLMTTLKQG
ncbi:hypothetical protein Zmor_023486 [Zophobas morio]|uniref:Uncharacterized protein n=1 Tax=Zophobas morio TaxID=2755281 RepID=A0AA38M7D5_9CUCU|nr:hypothetical protein Zmor_023486 [Zophobas morio]